MLRILFLLSLLPVPAMPATIFVPTKSFQGEWGEPPGSYDDFFRGTSTLRAWLEAKNPPRLTEATPALRKVTMRKFDLEKPVTVRYSVIGLPRSTNGHDPYFFAWIEWVNKDKFPFDLLDRRYERQAGVARVAIENGSERTLDIREWHFEKDLREAELASLFPWDVAVTARKMIDFHGHRPRVLPEKANGPGKHAPY